MLGEMAPSTGIPVPNHPRTLNTQFPEGYIGVIQGLYWDNGKENGSYYLEVSTDRIAS